MPTACMTALQVGCAFTLTFAIVKSFLPFFISTGLCCIASLNVGVPVFHAGVYVAKKLRTCSLALIVTDLMKDVTVRRTTYQCGAHA